MDKINEIIQSITSAENPIVGYIVIAALVLVGSVIVVIILRSILSTIITLSVSAVLLLIVLYATGTELPKIELPNNLSMPSFNLDFLKSFSGGSSSNTGYKRKDPTADAINKNRDARDGTINRSPSSVGGTSPFAPSPMDMMGQ